MHWARSPRSRRSPRRWRCATEGSLRRLITRSPIRIAISTSYRINRGNCASNMRSRTRSRSADSTRCWRCERYSLLEPCLAQPGRRRCDRAEAPLAPAKLPNGRQQVGGLEVGPHHAREDQLGVSALPQEKIAEAALSAGANQKVDRRAEGLAQRFAR